MSGFTVPLSSSPQIPSTPQSGLPSNKYHAPSQNGSNGNLFAPNPSTTPAGPPPSSSRSFTPAEPPPSSLFGSSQLKSGKTLFKSKGSVNSRSNGKALPESSINKDRLARFLDHNGAPASQSKPMKYGFGVPSSSPPQGLSSDDDGDYEEEDDVENLEDGSEEASDEADMMTLDSRPMDNLLSISSSRSAIPNESRNRYQDAFGSSLLDATPGGLKRSRGGSEVLSISQSHAKRSSKPKYESAIPSIIKSMVSQFGTAKLEESDQFIVETEDIIQQELYGTEILGDEHEQALKTGLPKASERLSKFWRSYCAQDMAKLAPKQEYFKGIGPDNSAPSMHKATFLASLQLELRHPPSAKGKQALAVTRFNRPSLRSKPPESDTIPQNPTAFPKVIIDWLNSCHDPYGPFDVDVQRFQPNPTAHFNYWDLLFSMTLRGKLADVIYLLKKSNFHYAHTAKEDRKDGEGYSNIQIRNIERVMNRATQVLEQCPSLRDDDWNVTGNEWIIFRQRVDQAIGDLATFAEGRDRDSDPTESTLEASNFGLRSTTMSLSQSSRRAESQVPWTIYQNLKAMYGILLGETTGILAMAQDWVEATIGLTAWWVGDDDEDVAVGSVALTRQSLRKSTLPSSRMVDINPHAAYLRRLAFALERVDVESSEEKGLAINTLSPIEVGLASIFEGNVEGVIGLLKAWSLPVATSVAEMASAGGWLNIQTGSGVMKGLDESDLILLNGQAPKESAMSRDSCLVLYADALSHRGQVRRGNEDSLQEGWELSVCLLSRLDDELLASEKVGNLLQSLPTDSDERVDTILETCKRFGIVREALAIAENYADHISETTHRYGTAVVYYARAHRPKKVKDVLDLLISLSLVQSSAYPALADFDMNLKALILEPRQSLGQIAIEDQKAAKILHTYLTGYATLRSFYDLRDEGTPLSEGQKPKSRPLARKGAAAAALIAVINSAADSIHGGLYDQERGAVVQVDALLTLLGEAMVFVNQAGFLLSLSQCFALLKAIEDLQSASPRIYSQCEECFRSTMTASRRGARPSSPRNLLKKTMSSMTSSFSIVGDSMIQSDPGGGSSRALAKSGESEKKGWDWRKGLDEKTNGADVLRILRLGLAKDIAKHWMAGKES